MSADSPESLVRSSVVSGVLVGNCAASTDHHHHHEHTAQLNELQCGAINKSTAEEGQHYQQSDPIEVDSTRGGGNKAGRASSLTTAAMHSTDNDCKYKEGSS